MLSLCFSSTSSGNFYTIQNTYLANYSSKNSADNDENLVLETMNKVKKEPILAVWFLCLKSL